jgi:hypothetical protein
MVSTSGRGVNAVMMARTRTRRSVHGCVPTRGRGRQGDIWATAYSENTSCRPVHAWDKYIFVYTNPVFFNKKLGGGSRTEVHSGGWRQDIARRKTRGIAGIFL